MSKEITLPVSNAKKLIIVKVGSDDRPASTEDIKDVLDGITAALAGDLIWVTHHLVKVEVVYLD